MSDLYPSFLTSILKAEIDLANATIKAQLIDQADITFNSAHTVLSDVAAVGLVGSPVTLANKSVTGGIFDADDITVSGVTGDSIEAALLYVDTGTAATSRLIGYFDGVSVTPNGGAIIVTWSNGASRIFAL